MLPNAVLLESKRIKHDTKEFHKLVYTGDQGNMHLTFGQYYLIKNDKAYVLTFTSETSQFAEFKETGEKIMNSFKVK